MTCSLLAVVHLFHRPQCLSPSPGLAIPNRETVRQLQPARMILAQFALTDFHHLPWQLQSIPRRTVLLQHPSHHRPLLHCVIMKVFILAVVDPKTCVHVRHQRPAEDVILRLQLSRHGPGQQDASRELSTEYRSEVKRSVCCGRSGTRVQVRGGQWTGKVDT